MRRNLPLGEACENGCYVITVFYWGRQLLHTGVTNVTLVFDDLILHAHKVFNSECTWSRSCSVFIQRMMITTLVLLTFSNFKTRLISIVSKPIWIISWSNYLGQKKFCLKRVLNVGVLRVQIRPTFFPLNIFQTKSFGPN